MVAPIMIRFVLLTLVTAVRHVRGADLLFQCPDDNQKNYPHTERCDHYFTCLEGLPIIRGCPANMLFDSTRGRCEESSRVTCLPYQRLKSPTDDDRIILMAKSDDNVIDTTTPLDSTNEQFPFVPPGGAVPFYDEDDESGAATAELLPAATSSWLHVQRMPMSDWTDDNSQSRAADTVSQSRTPATHCSDEPIKSTPSAPLTSVVYVTSTVWL